MTGVQRFHRVLLPGGQRHVVQDQTGTHLVIGDPFGAWTPGDPFSLEGVQLLSPVRPGKIVGIGLNYRDHAAERNKPLPERPLVFLKPPSAVIGPGDPIVLPPGVGRVDHEAELGVVIGRRVRNVPAHEARACIFGVTCVNDVTARDLQDRGVQFSHVKGYDTFAPIGPCIARGLDAADLEVTGLVNGHVRQRSTTRQLVFAIEDLIAFVSAIMTLEPGDVIATGTPAGIGPLVAGDTVTVRIAGVGELTNPVVAA
jgi:2-keto-4-pentenoate hydratase/2-oxohepta-3-ene-1,7-dioic acid hydratase in catechol pathway